MDVLNTLVNAAVIAIAGGLLAWFSKGRFDSLERRMDRLEERVDAVRSDLTQVALAVGAHPRASER